VRQCRQRPLGEQQDGRVFHLQAVRRVGRVAQHQQVAVGRALKPGPGGVKLCVKVGRQVQQRINQARLDHHTQGVPPLPKHLGGRSEGGQQAARRAVAHPGREQQAQPGTQFLALHGASLVFL